VRFLRDGAWLEAAGRAPVRGVLMAALLGVAACVSTPPTAAGPRPGHAEFDWFEYEGRDPVFEQDQAGPDEYQNPILAGFYPDPSITRVGDDYYLVNSTFAYFPGIPVFHSKDLVSWTQIGNVIDRPSQLNFDGLGISRGVFAPSIEHHDGRFYVVNTCVDCGGNFVATATNPAGPWSDPVWLPEIDGIDPSLFFDEDGKAYIVNNGPPVGEPLYDGHRALWIQEFDPASLRMVGPRTMIVNGGVDLAQRPVWIEGPHVFRRNGSYYLIAAEGGTGAQHSQVVFRGQSVRGPWIPYSGNPILTQRHLDPARPFPVTSAGHADFVQMPDGEWWATFLATRPYRGNLYNTGRETFLMPVRWVDGWPVIAAGTETVPYAHRRPALAAQQAPVPTSGNFTVRDSFDDASLAPYWTFIRTPRERWYDLASNAGALTIRARGDRIGMLAQPSFIGRRQQHAFMSASTAMRFAPAHAGEEAGLLAIQSDDHYYFLGVAFENGRGVVRLRRRAGAEESPDGTVVAAADLPVPSGATIRLRIDARGDRYDFLYSVGADEWTPLFRDADGTVLSTEVAGGFVGTMIGMYAWTRTPAPEPAVVEGGR
jgi:alpha-N-arabinofuranosidase